MARQPRTEPVKPKRPPGTTPEARENQMIALAVDFAEKQLREGTASAMVVTHYLKLGTTISRLEREKLERGNELLAAKSDAIASQGRVEELYRNALDAMRSYSGNENRHDD